jgi:DedD protein
VAKTPISDEELQLRKRARRRLIGAIVLVLLVVVLVPMFLEREPRLQKQDMDIHIPPIPGQTKAPSIPDAAPPPAASAPASTPPIPSEPSAQPAAPASAESTPAAPAAMPKPAAPETSSRPAPVAQRQSEQAAKAAARAAAKPAAGEGFVVQLGAFSNSANAKHLLQQIKAHKFPVYSEALKTPQGEKTRVRVGPYSSAEVAEKARARLKALKLTMGDARVVPAGE